MKVCLVCSHGGHFTETLQILEAFSDQELFFAIYHSARSEDVSNIARAYFTDNIDANPWRMLKSFYWSFRILWKEKPQVILSLGASIYVPLSMWAKQVGARKSKEFSSIEVNKNLPPSWL